MALLTNKLSISLAHEGFDARYDVFEVTKEGKGRLSWSSRVFEAFGAPYILSILGQGGDDPFYILAPKGRVSVRGSAIISRKATAALSRTRIWSRPTWQQTCFQN